VPRDPVQGGESILAQGSAGRGGEQITDRPGAAPERIVGRHDVGVGKQARVPEFPRQDRFGLRPARRRGRCQLRKERTEVAGGDRRAVAHERRDAAPVCREPFADERHQRSRLVVQALGQHRADARLVGSDDERFCLDAPRLLEQLLGEVERLARLPGRDQGWYEGPRRLGTFRDGNRPVVG
jgi:hypothetical protein